MHTKIVFYAQNKREGYQQSYNAFSLTMRSKRGKNADSMPKNHREKMEKG